VFSPTSGYTISKDVNLATGIYSSPSTPYDVTATGQTPSVASSVSIFSWELASQKTFTLQTSGFTNPSGITQWRNPVGNGTTLSIAYKIQSSASPTGNVANRINSGDTFSVTRWTAETFKETASFAAPSISSVTGLNSTTLRITHSAVTGADHYVVREATSQNGTYSVVAALDHTGTTVDRTGLTAGTTRCYQVAAANADESVIGPWTSTGVCGTTTSSTTGIKFHPGHYVYYPKWNLNDPAVMTAIMSLLNNVVCPSTSLTGIKIVAYWKSLEGDVANTYTFGNIDAILDRLDDANCNKRLMLGISPVIFGGYPPAQITDYFPAYIVNNDQVYGYNNFSTGLGAYTRFWQQATMDRLLALSNAIATHNVPNTNYTWDTHPNVEMLTFIETSLNLSFNTNGYTTAALGTQLKRFYDQSRTYWPRTALRLGANYFGNNTTDADMIDLISYVAARDVAIGGPDTIPRETIQANRVYSGQSGSTDYRPLVPFVSEVQTPSLGGHECDGTASEPYCYPEDLYDVAVNGFSGTVNGQQLTILPVDPSYFVWVYNQNLGVGDANQQWSAIYQFIQTNPPLNGICPMNYPGCITN
jgi:hypothetical protein